MGSSKEADHARGRRTLRRQDPREFHRWALGCITRRRVLRRAQPGGGRSDRTHTVVDARRRGCRGAGRHAGVSGLARYAGERADAGPLSVQGADRSALRRTGPHRHHRARQDAGRGARQRAPRRRVRRGGVRRAVAAPGCGARGHRARHRLPCRATAARSDRRDRAVQFPGHGPDVVSAVCDRERQHVRAQAVGTGAAVAARG